ncbi:sialidase family protein [Rufibacter roseolus]|uniref:sialidase family protein n=1 Tax=Rufibacter roseolus TaxID=2817375 RepID=UPI001B304A2A|nr:sialidase family protein [Rufibacter roseolus]
MELLKTKVWCLLLGVLFTFSCKSGDDDPNPGPGPGPTPGVHADDFPAVDNSTTSLNITWNATGTKLSHDVYFAEYGRVRRVKGDTLLLTYHYGTPGNEWDNIAIRRSIDDGATWSAPETLMADNNPSYYGFSNPDILVLKDGRVILAYTGRGNPDDNAHANIQIRISNDRGWTFGPPVIVATGRSWEPSMVQLPDGEIEIFYSSEARWWAGPGSTAQEQEILMVRSTDNGATWKLPRQVAYTPGMRDGMPVPVVLNNGKGIVFPIESVKNSKSPWIVWSSLEARFNYQGPSTTANSRRWLATSQNIWGGAPYLIQLPSGETILSCQDAGGRSVGADWKKNTMLVLVGNSSAMNFTNITYPWPNLPNNEGAYYSSMFLKDANTIWLITTRNFSDGHSEVYLKEGHIGP